MVAGIIVTFLVRSSDCLVLINVTFCQSLGCRPAASVDHFTPDVLASAELVEEVSTGAAKVVKVSYGKIQPCLYLFMISKTDEIHR